MLTSRFRWALLLTLIVACTLPAGCAKQDDAAGDSGTPAADNQSGDNDDDQDGDSGTPPGGDTTTNNDGTDDPPMKNGGDETPSVTGGGDGPAPVSVSDVPTDESDPLSVLAYLPEGAQGVLAIRPGAMLGIPAFQGSEYQEQFQSSDAYKEFVAATGLKIEDLELVVVGGLMDLAPPVAGAASDGPMNLPLMLVKTKAAIDREKIVSLIKEQSSANESANVEVSGDRITITEEIPVFDDDFGPEVEKEAFPEEDAVDGEDVDPEVDVDPEDEDFPEFETETRTTVMHFASDTVMLVGSLENVDKAAAQKATGASVQAKRIVERIANSELSLTISPETLDEIRPMLTASIPDNPFGFIARGLVIQLSGVSFDLSLMQTGSLVLEIAFKDENSPKTVMGVIESQAGGLESAKEQFGMFPAPEGGDERLFYDIAKAFVDAAKLEADGKVLRLSSRPGTLKGVERIPPMLTNAVADAKQAAERMQRINNLREVLISMHNHHEAEQGPLLANITSEDGKPLLSWRVQLLQHIYDEESEALYEQFKLDEPWDSEHNKALLAKMPAVYGDDEGGNTSVVVLTGEGTAFGLGEKMKFQNITDGTSNTIAIVDLQGLKSVPWTKPEDIPFNAEKPLDFVPKETSVKNILVGFLDGSVQTMNLEGLDADQFKAMITPQGGEVVDRFDDDGFDGDFDNGVDRGFDVKPEAFEDKADDFDFDTDSGGDTGEGPGLPDVSEPAPDADSTPEE